MSSTPPPSSETLAATLVALYVLAEQQLLSAVTRILIRTPATLAATQAAVPRIRRLVRQIIAGLAYRSNPLVVAMVGAAISEGRADAQAEASNALVPLPSGSLFGGAGTPPGQALAPAGGDDFFNLSMPHGERSAQAIRDDITSELEDVRFRLTRLPDDIYKMIAPHGGIYQVLANDFTPAQAQAAAWRVFTSQGITGFTDKSGRNWSLSAYVEMAVRTAAARAYNASNVARMQALGVNLVTIPDDGHPCPFCLPWQNVVMCIVPDGVHPSIADATAAGCFHPNCRHHLQAVFEGVTVLPAPQTWNEELQARYEATQRQRRLELAVRKAKSALNNALDPATRKEALRDILDGQRKLREFVRVTGLPRQSRREQVSLRDGYTKMPTPIR